jgi:hypothetical protein
MITECEKLHKLATAYLSPDREGGLGAAVIAELAANGLTAKIKSEPEVVFFWRGFFMRITRAFTLASIVVMLASVPPVMAQGVEYLHDDGTPEDAIGITGAAVDIWWANAFTVEPGGESIDTIRIDFLSGSNLTVGYPFSVHVYEDSDDDGNPTTGTLTLLASASSMVADLVNGDFQDIAIGPVTVSGGFFVAALITTNGTYYPAAIDQTASEGQSWIAADDASGIDPSNPLASPTFAPGTIDSYGFPGNWMLRAVASGGQEAAAIPVTGSAGLALLIALIGLAGTALLRRVI